MPLQLRKLLEDVIQFCQPRASFKFSFPILILAAGLLLYPFNLTRAHGPEVEVGKALFQKYCRDCHGPQKDGRGSLRPLLEKEPANLNAQATQAKTDQELFSIIKHGGGVEMHGWADTFSDDEIRALVGYLRNSLS